jgi:hypothetical protein
MANWKIGELLPPRMPVVLSEPVLDECLGCDYPGPHATVESEDGSRTGTCIECGAHFTVVRETEQDGLPNGMQKTFTSRHDHSHQIGNNILFGGESH